jgi:NlpC/P60 family
MAASPISQAQIGSWLASMDKPVTRSHIVAQARTYLGCKFHHQGRSRHGLDCAGLGLCVALDLGLLPPEYNFSNYGREPDGETFLNEIGRWCTPVEKFQPGDLLIFRIKINPRHAAIATHIETLDIPGMIHTYKDLAVTEHLIDAWWRDRIVQAYKFPGIEN